MLDLLFILGAGILIKLLSESPEAKKYGTLIDESTSYSDTRGRKVICYHCNKTMIIAEDGIIICPHCKKDYIYGKIGGRDSTPEEEKAASSFTCFFYLLGRIAKADGHVCDKEIETVSNIMDSLELNKEEKKLARTFFCKGKDSFIPTRTLASRIYRHHKNSNVLDGIITDFIDLALSDGCLDQTEKNIIKEVCDIFGVSFKDFSLDKENNSHSKGENTYGTLIDESTSYSDTRGRKVICYHCNKTMIIAEDGIIICPYCKKDYIYGKIGGRDISLDDEKDTTLITCTFYLFGRLAKSDGHVCENEIKTISIIMDELGMVGEVREYAKQSFQAGKSTFIPPKKLAKKIFEYYHDTDILNTFVEMLVDVAFSDNFIDPKEEEIIVEVCKVFGISADQYINNKKNTQSEKEKSHYSKNETIAAYYEVLKCKVTDPIETIRTSYKNLIHEYHPDKLSSKKLPSDLIKYSQQRFVEIQHAYEKIREHKGF